MGEAPEIEETNPRQLLGLGRRHLAVKDYNAAAETLATACELLAKEYSDTADQLAEPYLWYGKALLGLSREEAGVFGDKVPVTTKKDGEDEEDDSEENLEEGDDCDEEEQNGDDIEIKGNNDKGDGKKPEVSAKEQSEAGGSAAATDDEKPGPSNGEANESTVDLDNDEEVDNLQHAWEMLELSRSILEKRVSGGGGEAARAVLAEAHLALGEVALESETYDKAVLDLQKCLEIQQDIYHSDNRRIAETHYQIGLANSLASNFEDAITHFKAAANILETRIKNLENPDTAAQDSTVKKYVKNDPLYTAAAEIKEIKELLPEIKEKIQDMLDYKAETIKRVHETLAGANGSQAAGANGESAAKPAASDISHLVKRKRKSSEGEPAAAAAKRANTAAERC